MMKKSSLFYCAICCVFVEKFLHFAYMEFVYILFKICYTILVKICKRGFAIMKNIKKIISVVMAVVMIVSCMSILGYARDKEYVPTIIIPGLFQSETYHYVNGEKECDADGNPLAGPFYISISKEFIGAVLTTALLPVMAMFITQHDKDQMAAKAVSKLIGELLIGKQQSDANGNFIDDVRPEVYNGGFDTFSEKSKEVVLQSFPVQEYLEIAGEDNLYVFSYVSTGNMIQTVKDLYDYIQFVKTNTGSDKVNLVPVSQGGSIANGLMQYYNDNGMLMSKDINRIVFAVPALDGAALLGDCYRYGLNNDSELLYTTMFPTVIGVDNYLGYIISIITRLMPKSDVDNLLKIVADDLINDYLRYSTLLWGLIPSYDYEVCRDMYLETDDMAEIRRQTDWFYGAQKNSDANIISAKIQGIDVFDIVDTNVELYQLAVSHKTNQADGIIHVDSTSMGAYSVGLKQKLPADYQTPLTQRKCLNLLHDHTDPEGIMDVTTGLLPDHTFYFSGQNHANTAGNDVIMSLIIKLLTDEDFENVFSYKDTFPQFNYSRETFQLRKDVEEMRTYDRAKLTDAQVQELDAAIAEVDAMIADTTIDAAACKATNARFYEIYDEIIGNNSPFSQKNTSKMLATVTKGIAQGLYDAYGDAAFSEMPMLTLNKILGR